MTDKEDAVFDVAIIGGGVCGCSIARELSRFTLKTVLLEGGADFGNGASRANTAIIHGGYDPHPGTLKARFNREGLQLMYRLCAELGVEYKKTGSLVVAFNDEDEGVLHELIERGKRNGVGEGLRIVESRDELLKLEPGLSTDARSALLAEDAGIVCPYGLTFALADNASLNGVEFRRNFDVSSIRRVDGDSGFFEILKDGLNDYVRAQVVINAAGANCERIAKTAGAWLRQSGSDSERTVFRRGEYLVLDKNFKGPARVLFATPTSAGKGITVSPSVSGNTLVGPASRIVEDGLENQTSAEGLDESILGGKKLYPAVCSRDVIALFAGVRSILSPSDDFLIEESRNVSGFINVAGIQSPGLTSAPSIAKHVVSELVGAHFDLKENVSFAPGKRGSAKHGRDGEEKQGSPFRMICRCEHVSENEVIQSLEGPCGARTVNGVKLRTRAGMGRCQGGFCSPKVAVMLSKELGTGLECVTLDGAGSEILSGGKTK